LPIHSDFIRYNLATREAGAFEKWVQEGAGCIARKHPKGWPPVYRHFPVHHFVLAGSEQEMNLIGSLVSSQDKSGRVYPFSTLAAVGGGMFHTNRATLPLVCREFFRESQAFMGHAREAASVPALFQQLDELATASPLYQQRELVEMQIRLLETVSLKKYWNGLQVPATEREQFWCAFYDIMKTVQSRGPSRTNWGIRIPIPSEDDQTPYVVFWVQMVEAILEDRFWRAHYFWNKKTGDSNASMTLFFRPLPPSYLLPLLNQVLDDNAIFDLGREWISSPAFTSRVDLRRLLENDDIPMLEVLYRTGRREMLR
jgi:type VI secretion system protein ImpM